MVLIGVLLLFLLNPEAKVWLLRQLMWTGLYNADIGKIDTVSKSSMAFSFRDETGKVSSTGDLKGKIVFINFWATWCPPRRAEMPSLDDLYQQFRGDERIVFLFINEESEVSKVKAYLAKNKYSIPYMSRVGSVPDEIFSGTLPTTVLLDRQGRIVYKREGLAKYNTTEFVNLLNSLRE